jgi:UDPglucose 6-dehydrogenase
MGRYSIIGLGKLGASMAAALASRGHEIVGVDVMQRSVELVNSGHAPVVETDLEPLMQANHARIRATMSYDDAVSSTDITFVIVPTPSEPSGAFDVGYAARAFAQIGAALRSKGRYHLVVLTSTVLPGSTRYALLPILERESGLRCGADFGLCYSPEFIALGSVIRDFLHPDFTLIGEFDERSGELLEDAYRGIVLNGAPSRRMSIENAELAKIAVNTYITTKISFANMLAEICERIPGGDVDIVSGALGMDRRIGRAYLTGALGYGGPCFPRDNQALAFIARALGVEPDIASATDAVNRRVVGRIVQQLDPYIRQRRSFAILGLAYKPQSNVIEESQGVLLADALCSNDVAVSTFDPLYTDPARGCSLEQCLSTADVVVIATPDPIFKAIDGAQLAKVRPGGVVVDCWRLLDEHKVAAAGLNYVGIGRESRERVSGELLADLWSSGGVRRNALD